MEVRFVPLELARIDGLRYEAVVLPFFEDERPLRGAAGLCDWRLCGRLSRLLQRRRLTGALGEVTLVPVRPRLAFDKMLLFGAGPSEAFDGAAFDALVARMLSSLEKLHLRTFVLALPGRATGKIPPGDAIRWFLSAVGAREDFDEVVVLDDHDAQKAMAPVVEAERRRARVSRDVARDPDT